MSDNFEYLEGKSVSWALSTSKNELVEFLKIFKIDDVLRFVNIEELKNLCRKTDKKDKANSSTKKQLIEILSGYKVEQILKYIDIDELTR